MGLNPLGFVVLEFADGDRPRVAITSFGGGDVYAEQSDAEKDAARFRFTEAKWRDTNHTFAVAEVWPIEEPT